MPLGFFFAFLVLPGPPGLGGQREDRERPSRVFRGFAFRVLAQKAHKFDSIFVHILSLHFCPCSWGTRKREGSAPKARVCISGGTQKVFVVVCEEFLGGNGKAEDTKPQGAGIPPKPCPMKRVEWRPCTKYGELVLGETESTIHTGRSLSHRQLVDCGRGTRGGIA